MKRLSKISFVLLACAMLATGCAKQGQAPTNTKEETKATQTAENSIQVQTMDGKTLDAIMEDKKKKEEYLVIDVRSKDEYDAGHVKFAINMFVDDFEKNIDKIADFKDKDVVTICNSGKKSQVAAEILVKNGFKKVYNAEGVKSYSYTQMSKFENVLAPSLQEMADTNDGSITIIDVRDKKDYDQGHLKGAINIPVDSIDSEISKISKDNTVVTYCYSGNKSAVAAQKFIDAGFTKVINTLDGTKEHQYTYGE